MTTSPLINAFFAALYIVSIASFMYYGPGQGPDVEGVIMPVFVLSLFVLSAAVMGYLFLSRPLQLYLAGEHERGISLFVKTVAVFAGITGLFLIALLAIASQTLNTPN